MFNLIRSDYRRARELGASEGPIERRGWWFPLVNLGWHAVVIYRYGSWARRLRIPVLRYLALLLYLPLWLVQNFVCQASISIDAQIGPGFMVCRRGRMYVGPVTAGRNLYVSAEVVIAYVVRSIGDNVFFSVGSKALGPISIGKDITIGANAVVTSDVPDNSIVLSPFSRMVKRDLFEGQKQSRSGQEVRSV